MVKHHLKHITLNWENGHEHLIVNVVQEVLDGLTFNLKGIRVLKESSYIKV